MNDVGNSSGRLERKIWILWFVIIAVSSLCIGLYFQKEKHESQQKPLPKSEVRATPCTNMEWKMDCVPPSIKQFPTDLFTQEQRRSGYVILHICVTIYLCTILAIVCDQYFVPSLEIISKHLKVPVDVAGATFMAIGTSSPELYSAVIGSFVTEGDIGIGTIVGSAVFNILGVTSVTGLLLWRTEADVDWYPVSRDCLVYIFSVATLICIIQDNIVTWFESSLLILMFMMYITLMFYNHDIQESCKGKIEDLNSWWKKYRRARSHSYSLRVHRGRSRSSSKGVGKSSEPTVDLAETLPPSQAEKEMLQSDDSESDDDMSPWSVPSEGYSQLALWLITWPALIIITATIPNSRKPKEHLFLLTFLASVVWIGVISYLCSWMVTVIGYTFELPDSVAGITILAAGISVPEVIASVIVVRNGMANMAFSNLIGSNIFDILFCLGLPWLVKTLLFSSGGHLVVHSSALAYTATTLLSTVVLLFVTLSIAGWKLNWRVGLSCLGLYLLFLLVACMLEMNAFGEMNPPTCAA